MASITEAFADLEGQYGTAEFHDGSLYEGIVRILEDENHPLHFEQQDGRLIQIPLHRVRQLVFEDDRPEDV